MNWNKAKNYTIIFLVLVNIILLVLNFVDSRKTVLNQDDINDLTTVLNNNDIVMSCELPSKFKPMGTLGVESYEYDLIKVQRIFFEDISTVKRSEEFETIIFSKDNSRLQIKNNHLEFSTETGEAVDNINKALEIANGYEKKLRTITDGFKLKTSNEQEEGYSIIYMKTTSEFTLFSSYVQVDITKEGALRLTMEGLAIQDMSVAKSDIISAPEAVFMTVDNIKKEFKNTYVNITDVELGYYIATSEEESGVGMSAIPHYRIEVDGGHRVYYVNAYSGSVSS